MRRPLYTLTLTALILSPLSGCGNPEGYGSVDVEAGRRDAIAKGLPDPVARPDPAAPEKGPIRKPARH